jgi:DNA modification methylase
MTLPYHVLLGDCLGSLRAMPDCSVHTCITSPPYFGLRDYGHAGQIGLEATPEAYVARLVDVFREVRRVLRDDGTLWLNLGDSYSFSGKGGKPEESPHRKQATNAGSLIKGGDMGSGLPPKNLLGIPWRVAFALQADGWYLRQDIIWHKPNPMPESVTDRCTKAHEYLFLLSKSERYYFDQEAVKEPAVDATGGVRKQQARARAIAMEKGLTDAHIDAIRAAGITDTGKARETQSGTGKNTPEVQRLAEEAKQALGGYYREFLTDDGTRNRRSVWTVSTKPYAGAHFATFPPDLIEPCVLAGAPIGGTVLDPFGGSGTTAGVAVKHGRSAILCELNPAYVSLIHDRVSSIAGPLFAGAAE